MPFSAPNARCSTSIYMPNLESRATPPNPPRSRTVTPPSKMHFFCLRGGGVLASPPLFAVGQGFRGGTLERGRKRTTPGVWPLLDSHARRARDGWTTTRSRSARCAGIASMPAFWTSPPGDGRTAGTAVGSSVPTAAPRSSTCPKTRYVVLCVLSRGLVCRGGNIGERRASLTSSLFAARRMPDPCCGSSP